jgi:polyhydroxybutyrate depolymerase
MRYHLLLYKKHQMHKLVYINLLLLISFYTYSQEFSIIHDGLTRTYRLHLPEQYSPDSLYPLVINMHGLGSNALEQEIYTAFNEVADTGRIIVAYPNGISETWNVSSPTGTDDVGFISALIDTLDAQYSVDLLRIYATGMSMGGFMSYRLACELSDRIAAIASVTGLQAFFPCNPLRPVPIAHFHGTADPVVPYAGVASTINNWVSYNQCPDSAVVNDLPDIDTTDNSTVTVYNYSPCNESSEVILYSIIGGEHTWPGAAILIGVTNQDIKASSEIWNFFKKYTLQGPASIHNNSGSPAINASFYPNPVADFGTVELSGLPSLEFTFLIYDMNGKSLFKLSGLRDKRFLIDCSAIPPGLYIAEISGEKWRSFYKIIIK